MQGSARNDTLIYNNPLQSLRGVPLLRDDMAISILEPTELRVECRLEQEKE
jgi:hypothetical protein